MADNTDINDGRDRAKLNRGQDYEVRDYIFAFIKRNNISGLLRTQAAELWVRNMLDRYNEVDRARLDARLDRLWAQSGN